MIIRLFLLLCLVFLSESIIISTKYGSLQGYQVKRGSDVANIFKHIPFAAPPLGELRFALPQPPEPWEGIRDATKFGPACLSNSTTSKSPQKWIDEDCLHLNIYADNNCLKHPKSPCPVAFYLHGGGNSYDSAVMFEDAPFVKNFATEGVVLVVCAFRLGYFGVLTFGNDNVVPRNIAEYDKIAGLRWVQENIRNFGGDPNQVTLLGHSGGGNSAVLLGFSKRINPDKKLFHQIISMSAGISVSSPIKQMQITNKLAFLAGCAPSDDFFNTPTDNYVSEIVRCLRKLPALEILRIQRELEEKDKNFSPSGVLLLEPLYQGNSFSDLLQNPPSIPLLIGTTSVEFSYEEHPGYELTIANNMNYQNPISCARKYKDDEINNRLDFNVSLDTQLLFTNALLCAQAMRATGAPVFMYSYRNPKHPMHTDDLFFISGVHPFEMDRNEMVLSYLYPQYFRNFIKYGRPEQYPLYLGSTTWQPMGDKNNYFYIDVNRATGLIPHNADYYEKELNKYWLEDMRNYDRMLTKLRMDKEKAEHLIGRSEIVNLVDLPESTIAEESGVYNAGLFALTALIFILLFFTIREFMRKNQEDSYIPISEFEQESTFLMKKLPKVVA